MVHTRVDALIQSVSSMQGKLYLPIKEIQRLHDFEVDLKLIRMFLFCSVSWDSDADSRCIFTSIESIQDCLREYELVSKKLTRFPSDGEVKNAIVQLWEKILFSKPDINKYSEHLLSKSFTGKPLTSHEIHGFLDAVIIDIDHLLSLLANDFLIPVKNKMKTIKEKLLIFRILVEFTGMRCADCKALEDFNIHVLTWTSKAACLMYMYFEGVQLSRVEYMQCCIVLGKNGSEKKRIDLLVTDLLQKVNPCTPEFIDMCFGLIKLTKSSYSYIILFEELVPSFVDFLLQNLMSSTDDFRVLREGLICLISFLAGPPVNYAENSELIYFQSEIDAVLIEASYLICMFGGAKLPCGSTVLAKFLRMIEQVKEKIKKHFVQLSHSSWSYFPRTNGLGFVECFLVYLNDLEDAMSSHPKLVPFLKHQIATIKDELASFRPFLQDVLELLNDHKELKDIWEEIISVAYQAEHAINQSFFIDRPLCLSYVLCKIQAIQSKLMRVEHNHVYTTRINSSLATSENVFKVSVPSFVVNEEVVGFKQEAEELINRLTRGTKKLDIVSIVGMGGGGKTTLAKKLYNEESVKLCFHRRAFCTVSQVYRRKNIVLDIFSQLNGKDANVRDMMEEDSVLRLYQSLKGYKYLIVLDDLWDIHAWNSIKDSFPDDYNGSRVIFTTRINELASVAKPNCSPLRLRSLSFDESWALLQIKIFNKDACPPYLSEVGRLIARSCKGLPLAIVLIAGVLAKSERSLSFWRKVASNLTSYVSSEGGWDALELSYQHLSDASKACFLYLGAFPEDYHFAAGYITRLWAAERFFPNVDRSCMDKVGKECLNYLGERCLLIITERSLGGNIKRFHLHDVTRDFCTSKAQEEHLVCKVKGHDGNSSMPLIYDRYRIFVQDWRSFINANPRGPAVHSLHCFENDHYTYKPLPSSSFEKFRLIQVLNLPTVVFLDFPSELTALVHLRYLALEFNHSLRQVPPTIANLQNLETLHFEGSDCLEFPNTIWKMKRLKHLEVKGVCVIALDDVASKEFSKLPVLESIGIVRIGDGDEGEELLRRLPNVRKLSCHCYELPQQLVNLSMLESLSILWYDYNLDRKCSLSLPSNLRKLSLEQFSLPRRELSTMIGSNSLRFLQVLNLVDCNFYGDRWDVEEDEFPNLKCLTIRSFEIKYWNAATDSFPCLKKLVLKHCQELVEIPPCFGEVPTLCILQVRDCSEGVIKSAIQIQEEQLAMGNDSLQFEIGSFWKLE